MPEVDEKVFAATISCQDSRAGKVLANLLTDGYLKAVFRLQ
jgi:hypothetical protein